MDIGLLNYINLQSNSFFIILEIIAGLVIAIWLWDRSVSFYFWITRKIALLIMGLKLIRSKDKLIKDFGWQTIKLAFWEIND